jgi:ABC-type polysaccharide/polyol phosphate export permease
MTLWHYRTLLASLVARNIKVKYQRSVLGFLWSLLNPLVMVAVLGTVFTYVVRIGVEHYWAFLVSGFFVWNYFSTSLYAAAYTLPEHAHVTRSIAFPKELLVIGAGLSRLVEFVLEIVLVVVILAVALHGGVPSSYVLLPYLVLLQFALAIGLQLPIATLAVFYKDVEHALPIALTALFYLTPVFYPVSLVPEVLRPVYFANPLAQLVTIYHQVLYEGRFPDASLLLTTSIVAVVLLAAGWAVFNRYKRLFAEIV